MLVPKWGKHALLWNRGEGIPSIEIYFSLQNWHDRKTNTIYTNTRISARIFIKISKHLYIEFFEPFCNIRACQVELVVKNPTANAGDLRDTGSIPGLGRSSGRGHGNPLQYSCLENLMDTGAWLVPIHRVAKSQTWPKRPNTHTHTHTHTQVLTS